MELMHSVIYTCPEKNGDKAVVMKKMGCVLLTVRKQSEQKLRFLEDPFSRFKISVTRNKGVGEYFKSSL